MFFDDLPVGFVYETEATELPLDAIMEFARQWDPQPFHIDPEAAKDSPYGGIIASGFHTILISFIQTLNSNTWNEASMGSPGMDEVRWLKPVRPGDVLRTKGTVLASTPSKSRPDRGRTEVLYEISNQDGDVVSSYKAVHILRRKPEDAS